MKRTTNHIIVEIDDSEKAQEAFENIQNDNSYFDNCVLETDVPEEDSIVDPDRQGETNGSLTWKRRKSIHEKKEDFVWRLQEQDIQDEALIAIGRKLTDEEMDTFKRRFQMVGWDEIVRDSIQGLVEEGEIKAQVCVMCNANISKLNSGHGKNDSNLCVKCYDKKEE